MLKDLTYLPELDFVLAQRQIMPHSMVITNDSISITCSIPTGVRNVQFTGTYYSNGNFRFTSSEQLNFGNFNVTNTSITFDKNGMSGKGCINYGMGSFNASFSIDEYGKFNTSDWCAGQEIKLVDSDLLKISGKVNINITGGTVKAKFSASVEVWTWTPCWPPRLDCRERKKIVDTEKDFSIDLMVKLKSWR